MKKIFLASSFKDVSEQFQSFMKKDLKGKTVTFIPTASLPEKQTFFVEAAKKSFATLGMVIDELELSQATPTEIRQKLESNDVIYVTGGNTFFLLQELKKSGADILIQQQVAGGKIYIGESAGAVVASPNIEYIKAMDDVKKAPELESFQALNLVDISPVPHYASFPFKEVVENIITNYDTDLKLIPISNKQAILIDGDNIIRE